MNPYLSTLLLSMESQPYYWRKFIAAAKSWRFRMSLPDEELVMGIYQDGASWFRRRTNVRNFWDAINEGHSDMTWDYFCSEYGMDQS